MADLAVLHLDQQVIYHQPGSLHTLDRRFMNSLTALRGGFCLPCALMLKVKAKHIAPTASTSHARVHPLFDFIAFLLV
jgi:hypothetical protein